MDARGVVIVNPLGNGVCGGDRIDGEKCLGVTCPLRIHRVLLVIRVSCYQLAVYMMLSVLTCHLFV